MPIEQTLNFGSAGSTSGTVDNSVTRLDDISAILSEEEQSLRSIFEHYAGRALGAKSPARTRRKARGGGTGGSIGLTDKERGNRRRQGEVEGNGGGGGGGGDGGGVGEGDVAWNGSSSSGGHGGEQTLTFAQYFRFCRDFDLVPGLTNRAVLLSLFCDLADDVQDEDSLSKSTGMGDMDSLGLGYHGFCHSLVQIAMHEYNPIERVMGGGAGGSDGDGGGPGDGDGSGDGSGSRSNEAQRLRSLLRWMDAST